MNNGLGRAITLAIGVASFLLVLPVLPHLWALLSLFALVFHTIGMLIASRDAGKSPVRFAAFIHTLLLIASVANMILFFESTWLHLFFVLFSSLLLALYDYHVLHFLRLPSERSRTVMLFTSWLTQSYILFVATSGLLGRVIYIHMSANWLYTLTGFVAAVCVFPMFVFFEKRVPMRLMSTLICVLVTVEVAWAVSFLPFGASISALFVALTLSLALRIGLRSAGEFTRDNPHKWLYAAGVLATAVLLVLLVARWV